MKAMKGRFLEKLSFFPTISTLKQGLVLQIHPPAFNPPEDSISISQHVKDFKDQDFELKFSKESTNSNTESDDDDDLLFVDAREGPEQEQEQEGSESVIFYTTSFKGIRKTYEDCSAIRFLLESLGVMFEERDVSMHMEFREELWRVLGGRRVIPPRLFVKGMCIGGAEEVVALHEQGQLRDLLSGLPLDLSNGPCIGCGNIRFVVCPNCHGSCKVVAQEDCSRCPQCNENGLAKCPICRQVLDFLNAMKMASRNAMYAYNYKYED